MKLCLNYCEIGSYKLLLVKGNRGHDEIHKFIFQWNNLHLNSFVWYYFPIGGIYIHIHCYDIIPERLFLRELTSTFIPIMLYLNDWIIYICIHLYELYLNNWIFYIYIHSYKAFLLVETLFVQGRNLYPAACYIGYTGFIHFQPTNSRPARYRFLP